jgi:hypothetical protein
MKGVLKHVATIRQYEKKEILKLKEIHEEGNKLYIYTSLKIKLFIST